MTRKEERESDRGDRARRARHPLQIPGTQPVNESGLGGLDLLTAMSAGVTGAERRGALDV